MSTTRRLLGFLALVVVAGPAAADKPPGYPFRKEPVATILRLGELEASPLGALAPEERTFLEGLSAGAKPDPNAFAAAALWASGVQDAARRAKYLSRLDAIAKEALAKMAKDATVADKGKALLEYLHAGPMAKGYVSHQSSLAETLDAGTFNCVSSVVLYNVVARRIGLDVRAVEQPSAGIAGHVYSVLDAGGKRVRVETTNARGFDQGKVELRGNDRETGDLGLAALIYANRSSELAKEKTFVGAARTGLGALALDATNPTSAKNTLAAFVNWGNDLSKSGRYEDALKVIAFGLELAPKDSTLNNNHKVTWHEYATAAMKADDPAAAVARLRRAAAAIPDGGFDRDQADLFLAPGEKLVDAGKWDDAAALAAKGIRAVDNPKAKQRLEDWHVNLYRRWSQAAIDKADFVAAAAALAKGCAKLPGHKELNEGIAYLGQEWLAAADKDKGPPAAAKACEQLRRQFPDADKLADVAQAHAQRAVRKKVDAGKFDEAIAAVAAYEPLLGGAKELAKLGGYAHDGWARSLAKKKDWEAAVKVYVAGLKAYPGESLMSQNAIATIDQWAKKSVDAKDYAEAARVYRRGLESFPNDKHLKQRLDQCERNLKKVSK